MSMEFAKHQQLMLQIDVESRYQQDAIITRIRQMVKDFNIAAAESDPKKSPFRNVMNVAMEPTSSLEVIKTYIRYQSGRRETNKVWIEKFQEQRFANAVITAIDGLSEDTDEILARVHKRLGEGEIKDRLVSEQNRLKQDLHLKLAQLYFGYLYREHTAAIGESPRNNSQGQARGVRNQNPSTQNNRPQPSNSGRPQLRN
jgi:hypothetical protein